MAKKAGSKRKEVQEHEDEVSKFGIYPVFMFYILLTFFNFVLRLVVLSLYFYYCILLSHIAAVWHI